MAVGEQPADLGIGCGLAGAGFLKSQEQRVRTQAVAGSLKVLHILRAVTFSLFARVWVEVGRGD
ncbi:hypothetical protein ACZ90_54030 [Streptomyces albus subsp. albus]|nr:hypothetical protein ACZ90_54030 [Streptomyces albus subsp. albus]